MTSRLFLPNRYKRIGWFLLVPAAIAGIFLTITGFEADWLTTRVFAFFSEGVLEDGQYFTVIKTNVTNTLVGVIFIIGALMVSLSKEKHEDEFISDLRLSSLLWALWFNYVLLLLAFIFVYG